MIQYRSFNVRQVFIIAAAVGLSAVFCSTSIAQEAAPSPTPLKRQPIMAPIVTPPGYKGPKVQQFRGFATPAVTRTPATDAGASPVVIPPASGKTLGKMPKPLELTVKAKPGQKAVHVTWKADARASTFTLERAEAETGPFSAVAIMTSPEGSFDDENSVFAGTTYYYRMMSQFEGFEGAIVSALSSPVQVIANKPEGTTLDSGTSGSSAESHSGTILPPASEKSSESATSAAKNSGAKNSTNTDAKTTSAKSR